MGATKEIRGIRLIGAATIRFGEHWCKSLEAMASEAVAGALDDANLFPEKIDSLFVANMLSGTLGGQENLGPFMADALGIHVPAVKIEGACASGGLALHTAVRSIEAGESEVALVLGVEKMTDFPLPSVAAALMAAGSEEERLAGLTQPALYALLARRHMEEFGTLAEEMAAVAVKNHYHASLNPKAQFRRQITIERVRRSPLIAAPLRLLDCSPISDGAAAVIITNDKRYRSDRRAIRLSASAIGTDTTGLGQRVSLLELKATREAAQKAYEQAAIGPDDVSVAEVHDCFTIAEILAMEDLGFYPKGEAAQAIAWGETRLGTQKDLTVNSSGGLKGCGHPIGATGLNQIVELVTQLRQEAGSRQVANAGIGLSHNVSGSGVAAVVHILKR